MRFLRFLSQFGDVRIYIHYLEFGVIKVIWSSTNMYSLSPGFLKIPKRIATLRNFTLIREPSKIVSSPSVYNSIIVQRSYSNEKKHNGAENLRQNAYKYLCYSLLCSAAAYTSYKMWLVNFVIYFYNQIVIINLHC